jgi:hypothetical protein
VVAAKRTLLFCVQIAGVKLRFEPGPGGRLVEILPGGEILEIGRITA